MTEIPKRGHFIGGQERVPDGAQTFETRNPATGAVLATVTEADGAIVDQAVADAQRGFLEWSALSGAERGRRLWQASRIVRDRRDKLARLEVQDTGKPIAEAPEADIDSCADCIEYFAGAASKIEGRHMDLGGDFAYTRREPLGVCAGIGAWNYPIQIAGWKSAPALAAGNAMVYKPSEMTPLTTLELANIYIEAGVPAGVFNVVQGTGAVGSALASHPGIAKVSFTGSVPTGRRVMADAAETLKDVTMELGGKSPLIVFDDASIEDAVNASMLANFYTQGEICTNGTRVFLQEGIADAFLERLLEKTARLRIGDPGDPETDIGSLISPTHMGKVLDFINGGVAAGAKLLCGGKQVTTPPLDKGSFVEPTVFDGCTDDMHLVREEIFGPVMSVLRFSDEAEVVRRANGTDFGLAAGVFTANIQRGHRMAAALKTGTCWINSYNLTPIEMPVGGVKQSGIGRENSMVAIDHYTQLKSVYVAMGPVETPYR
ncbi:betaine-aldehyde dehydrogenase [Fodinicurvata sp. EGI_FJ10296]|uniref:betaine-aldehyde dehydrogenase n=1 Tax=Fodinicurvata sp. EGI_FJ10296 TaxID=3231908 RepID=UPI00345384AA